MSVDPWPFDQPRECAVFAARRVCERLDPILYVAHFADDRSWQFVGMRPPNAAEFQKITLGEAVELDPTILQLADLPPGWFAFREVVTVAWTREAAVRLMAEMGEWRPDDLTRR